MTIKQDNHFVYDHILVRYGELSTKGKNKKDFINKLLHNVKNALRGFPALTYQKTHDRLYIMLNDENPDLVSVPLKKVFGIRSFSYALKVASDIDEIKAMALHMAKEFDGETFKIVARRSDKNFPMMSDDINRSVAGDILRETNLKVNVKTPDLKIQIEVHREDTYIMSNVILGSCGYPVGVGGKALVMLSGGIDSPVASYLTMKRGVGIECIHYASPPYTSAQAQEKVMQLATQLAGYQGHIRMHIVPFTKLQLAIYENCDESYAITIMRRMMYRIAQAICEKSNCLAIVNGESIGQVASQTLESMATINAVVTCPVIRPVATMDKLEIIELAREINTYETSIQPFEDCCTIFTPKNPVTKPTIRKVEMLEKRFDFETLVNECVEACESMNVYPTKVLDDEVKDLF
ncbi:MAG: tRNA uracil 4-sulfurtransferase ThiI [Erysipelotrichaceae bacterium]